MKYNFQDLRSEQNILFNIMMEGDFIHLDTQPTSDHFSFNETINIFSAIKDLIDRGEDTSPRAVQLLSGVDEKFFIDMAEAYIKWSVTSNMKVLEDMRQQRAVQELTSNTLADFSQDGCVDVPEKIQKLSTELVEAISTIEVNDDFAERTRQHLIELSSADFKPIKTGLVSYDTICGGIFTKELHIIGGFPSVGKSAMCLQMARNMSKNGESVKYFSLEEDERNYMKRIISAETRFPYSAYRNGLTLEQRKQQGGLYAKVFREGGTMYNCQFDIDDKNDTLESIWFSCAKHKKKFGLDVVFIDGATNIAHKESNLAVRYENIAQTLLKMAKELDIVVFLVSHISNEAMKKDKDGNKKVPTKADFYGGSAMSKPAFSALILDTVDSEFIPNKPVRIDGHLVKARNSAQGQIAKFNFIGNFQTYESRDGEQW